MSHTTVLTIVFSTLAAVVIGGMLHYTLKRHDVTHAQAVEVMAGRLSEEKAVAAGRVLATLSSSVIQSDLARVQELVEIAMRVEGLRDVMIVNRDNVVLAAKNPGQVGQKLQDATWLSWKGQNREVAQRAVDQAGQPVFAVVEPLNEKSDIMAWAMLIFAAPPGTAVLRPSAERLAEVVRLTAPIFVFLLMSVGLAMKLATAAIRKQIQGVMASMLEEPAQPDGEDWVRKAG